jgi:hypothetical protein
MNATIIFRIVLTVLGFITVILTFVNALLAVHNRQKITEIKVSVDGRMDAAIEDIKKLKEELAFEKTQPAETNVDTTSDPKS